MGNRDVYKVSYRFRAPGAGWTRTDQRGNVSQWSEPPSRSETGVMQHLKKLHAGKEILIEDLEWGDEK